MVDTKYEAKMAITEQNMDRWELVDNIIEIWLNGDRLNGH
jgi:hypothetical protein